jgi:hypothetical protein
LATQLGGAEVFYPLYLRSHRKRRVIIVGRLRPLPLSGHRAHESCCGLDSQSAPRHRVSRVSLYLSRAALTAIRAGGLGEVDS